MLRRAALRLLGLTPLVMLMQGQVVDPAALERYEEKEAFQSASDFRDEWNQWIKMVDLEVFDLKARDQFRKVKKAWKRLESRFAALGYK